MAYGEGELSVDLECGGTTVTSEEEGSGESVSSCGVGSKELKRGCNRALGCNGIMSGESDTDSSDDSLNISHVVCGQMELLVNKCSGCEETRDIVAFPEKRNPGEPRRKQNLKKYCKPPRPPKGPLLNPSDLKLVKELSEIAARKRARVERMKALRKVKLTKRRTSSSSLTALVITIIFFVIIVFQGVFSGRIVRRELLESPAPSTSTKGLISIQLVNNAPTNEVNQPSSFTFNSVEQPSSSSPQEEGREAG